MIKASVKRTGMRKVYLAIRVFIAFALTAYSMKWVYGDFFAINGSRRFLFLVWGIPCLYFVVTCMQLMMMIVGLHPHKYEVISVDKICPVRIVSWRIPAQWFYVSVRIRDKIGVARGLFFRQPETVRLYSDLKGKVRVLSAAELMLKSVLVLTNFLLAGLLKFLIVGSLF